jgi:U3 small nucleolar RNA-associated protein 23
MIMEPMAGATSENRDREERGKFRTGLKRGGGGLKRKREDHDDGEEGGAGTGTGASDGEAQAEASKPKNKTVKGPKGPNPLSVKKPKKKSTQEGDTTRHSGSKREAPGEGPMEQRDAGSGAKRKRIRKHKSAGNGAEVVKEE